MKADYRSKKKKALAVSDKGLEGVLDVPEEKFERSLARLVRTPLYHERSRDVRGSAARKLPLARTSCHKLIQLSVPREAVDERHECRAVLDKP